MKGCRAGFYLSPLIGIVLAGCGNPADIVRSSANSSTTVSTIVVVFADVSKSTVKARPQYASFFRNVIGGAGGDTLVLADEIDADPLSTSSLPVRGQFWKSTLLGKNPAQVRQHNNALRASMRRGFAKLLTRNPKGDSILDALTIAQNVFDNYSTAKTRELVILSDMVENSKRYPFTPANLEPKAVRSFIGKERKNGNLPDLTGVDVYVDGAGVTRGSESATERVRAVKAFWMAYFKATGAQMPPYQYAPALVKFP